MDECNKTVTESSSRESSNGINLKVITKQVSENDEPESDKKLETEFSVAVKSDRRSSLNVSLGPISASRTEQCSTSGLVAQGIASPVLLLLGALGIFLLEKYDLVEIIDPILGIVGALGLCISFFPQRKTP